MGGFGPTPLASAGKGTGASAAAGAVNVGAAFSAMRTKAPKYDQLSAAAMDTQSKEKIAGWNAQAQVAGAGVQSLGQVAASGVSAYGQMRAAEIQAARNGDVVHLWSTRATWVQPVHQCPQPGGPFGLMGAAQADQPIAELLPIEAGGLKPVLRQIQPQHHTA